MMPNTCQGHLNSCVLRQSSTSYDNNDQFCWKSIKSNGYDHINFPLGPSDWLSTTTNNEH
jgi:hypothetical protein